MTTLQPNLTKLTEEEMKAIMDAASEALERDDDESFFSILKQAPLDAHQADELKNYWGIESLIEGGFNLSEAVATYGQEWLYN
jgi:hypothetical protein